MLLAADGFSDIFSHDFVVHAFLAGTFIAVIGGIVGYFIVLRNQVFVADAQSHTAFAGALAALAFGVDLTLGLFAATIAGSVTMGALGGRSSRGRDVGVGTTFAWILGLGVLFLSIYRTSRSTANGAAGISVLFGSIFGLTSQRATLVAVVAATGIVVMLALMRPLLFASIDPDVAAARGVPVRALGAAFMVTLGVTVGEAVQAVGALLIFALMVTPGLVAQLLTARPYAAIVLSAAVSLLSLWIGLILSYLQPQLPPSFTVVAVVFVVYIVVLVAKRLADRSAAPGTP